MAKRKRRAFDAEFKAEAMRLCKVGDRSIGQVAKDLDLTETALRERSVAQMSTPGRALRERWRPLSERSSRACDARTSRCWWSVKS
jgi:transposase-like protein